MREQVPSTGSVAVVVEPRAENQVCSDAEEETTSPLVIVVCKVRMGKAYITINHVKNPQWPEESPFLLPR